MLRKIKKMIVVCALLSLAAAILVSLSLEGERRHQASCRDLGVECEPGRMQLIYGGLVEWMARQSR